MRRIGRYCAYAIGVLVLVVLAAALLLPALLDRPRIAAQIQAKLSAAVEGEVRWDAFSVRILPSPHGMLRGLKVKTAAATVSADEVTVALRLWPLFRGRAEISSLALARPLYEVTVVPSATVPQEAQLAPAEDPMQGYRSIMGAAARHLQEFAPDSVVAVEHAEVRVSIEGIPPLELSDLSLRARTSSEGVAIEASAKSRYWTRMTLAGRLRYTDLASSAELHLARVRGQAWLDWLLRSAGIAVAIPEADLDARFSGDAAKRLELELDGRARTLTLARGGKRVAAAPVVLKAKLAVDASDTVLHVERLAAGATSIGGGVLRYSPKSGIDARDVGLRVDLAQVLVYGRELAPRALERIESASGTLAGRAQLAWTGEAWRFGVAVEQSDAAVHIRDLPGPLRLKSGRAEVDAGGVKAERVRISLPAGNIHVTTARYAFRENAATASAELDLDVARSLTLARAALPAARRASLDIVESAAGRLRGSARGEWKGRSWSASLRVTRSDAQAKLKPLTGPIRLASAAVDADTTGVKVEHIALAVPAGSVRVSKARYAFKTGAASASAELDLDVARTLALLRGVLPEASRASLDIVETARGRVKGNASGQYTGRSWNATLELAESDVQAKLKPLPGPIALGGATVRATEDTIAVERAALKLLDASATASATLSDYARALRVTASVAEATLGPQLIEWLWRTAALPPKLEPNAPVSLTVPRLRWSPDGAFDVDARARFASGPQVAVELARSGEGLDVRRIQVRDARSSAEVALRVRGGTISGRYSGTLDSRTFAAMLKSATAPAGAVSGEMRFAYDRADPRRATAEGTLKGEHIDLSWAAGVPAEVERLDLSADGNVVRIAEASVQWAGQRASVRGEAKRGPHGPVIDAQIESPGVRVDALLPKPGDDKAPKEPPAIWPLPVTGRIAVRSKLVQYQHYRVAPLSAVVVLERERATLDVQEALLCGLALPLTVEATPAGFNAAVQVAAQKQKVEESVECLAGEKLLLTGPMDLRLDVRTQGRGAALLQNLNGSVRADIRNGTVTKFALLGNILSLQNVAAALKDGPRLGAEAFPFRQMSAKGRFDNGRFHLDEGVFHSNAIGLGANGSIGLADFQSDLTVLVAPLALVDEAVRKLPILGYVIGGTFTSLPVAVSGDIRDPRVVPLGPSAITDEMKGLLSRTLSLPSRAVSGNRQ